jgi:UDP-N-acetylmuramoyl-tripeptide--D-alanyl-D-alanine ligase
MIFTAEQLAKGTGGELMAPGPIGRVVTDSRKVGEGDWFLALKGDRFDGHEFLSLAAQSGCAGVIAARVPEGWAQGWVRVDDGLQALTELARFVRAQFTGPVVGITGSAGKTTTRALAGLVAAGLGRVHQTEGNLNNHVGVPLTILAAPVDAAVWVIEMGMNHLGEIKALQAIARPTIRLITNVGAAHLEGVGDLAGVARAKGELFDGAMPGDVCLVNQDDERVRGLPIPPGVRVLCYGSQIGSDSRSSTPLDVILTDAHVDPQKLVTRFRIEVGDQVIRGTLPSPGLHLAHDACAAVAVGVALRVPLDGIGRALGQYQPVGMRLRIEPGPRGSQVINDAYNANPMSMEASLDMLAGLAGVRRIAVLGDMLELGGEEATAHASVLRKAHGLGLDGLFVAGPRFRPTADALGIPWAPDAASLAPLVDPVLQEGDVLLLKGSRGMSMERVLQTLKRG